MKIVQRGLRGRCKEKKRIFEIMGEVVIKKFFQCFQGHLKFYNIWKKSILTLPHAT